MNLAIYPQGYAFCKARTIEGKKKKGGGGGGGGGGRKRRSR